MLMHCLSIIDDCENCGSDDEHFLFCQEIFVFTLCLHVVVSKC